MPLTTSLKRRRRRRGKAFIRQQWWFKPSLGIKWRRPRGHQSKMRRQKNHAPPVPLAGYGSPALQRGKVKGKHAILVSNVADLQRIDTAAGQAAIIASAVSVRKVAEIAKAADQLGVQVLNPRRLAKASHRTYEIRQKKLAKEAAKAAAKKGEAKKEEGKKGEEKPAAEAKKPEEKKPEAKTAPEKTKPEAPKALPSPVEKSEEPKKGE